MFALSISLEIFMDNECPQKLEFKDNLHIPPKMDSNIKTVGLSVIGLCAVQSLRDVIVHEQKPKTGLILYSYIKKGSSVAATLPIPSIIYQHIKWLCCSKYAITSPVLELSTHAIKQSQNVLTALLVLRNFFWRKYLQHRTDNIVFLQSA